MKNIYLLLVFIVFLSLPIQKVFAQNSQFSTTLDKGIEGLSVYPNPVKNSVSTIFITSNNRTALKKIAVYNVLGTQVKKTVSTRKALDISDLKSGVYILKITEDAISETRKLVIK